MFHEVCPRSMFSECGPCDGGLFHNLSQFFDLDLTVNEFWYFFDIGHIEGVGQLRSRHRLFDNSKQGRS